MIIDGIHQEDQTIRSFLMIGQSNMAGRGFIEEAEPIVNPNCYMLRMGRWQPMSEPVNPDRAIFRGTFRSGVTLAASFADEYAKRTGSPVGLIPCADGGSRVTEWAEGEVLFDHAVAQTRLAMRHSVFSGILWHQGESDCDTAENLEKYNERFKAMIAALRRELNAEELPVLIGEITDEMAARWYPREAVQRMNRNLHELEKEVPNCRVVSSHGIPINADGIHFSAPGCRIFGRRYYEALTQFDRAGEVK